MRTSSGFGRERTQPWLRRSVVVAVIVGVIAVVLLSVPFGARGATGDTWSGTWERHDVVVGKLYLTQNGLAVSGHYTWNDASGTVSGSVSGQTFSGSFNETHYRGTFALRLGGEIFSGSYSGVNKDTNGNVSGPFTGTCIAGPCLQNAAKPSNPNTAQTGSVDGEVTVIHSDGSETPLTAGGDVKRGDQLRTGVDSHAVLKFADGSRVEVPEMTQLYVADLLVQGSRQNVTVALKMGEVSAQVNPKKAYQTDFKVSTPSGTLSSRGTAFTVFYDPLARVTIVRTLVHKVLFTTRRPASKTILVPAGKEVEVTATGVSPLAPLGKADTRGGIDRRTARDRVVSLIDRATAACHLTWTGVPVYVQSAGTTGWTVTVTVQGKVAGSSSWLVRNGKVGAANAAAMRIATGC